MLARKVSLFLSHPFVSFLFLIIVSAYTENFLLSFVLSLFFISILPVLPILILFKEKGIDIFVENKEERPFFFTIAMLCFLFSFLTFSYLDIYYLKLLSLCYLIVTFTIFIINIKWKISVHTSAIAGPVTFLVYFFGYYYSFFYLLLLPAIWSRLKTNSHTPAQLIAGIFVSSFVTLFVISIFPIF